MLDTKPSVFRSILTILLAVVVLGAAQTLAVLLGNLCVEAGLPAAAGNVLMGIAYPLLALPGLSLLCRKLCRLTLADCRIGRFRLKPVWAVSAVALPVLTCACFLLVPGHWEVAALEPGRVWTVVTGGVVFTGFAVGIVEEAVFRGVILTVMERRWNRWAAILVPSMLFGLLHILGRELNFMSIVQLFVAGSVVGVLFSLIALEGGVWCSALVHAVWNLAVIGGIVQIGTKADESLFSYVLDTDSFLLTGGDFGIEASVISILGYGLFIALALVLLRRKMRSKSSEA